MKIKLLALLISPALMSQSVTAADQNHAIVSMTSWGLPPSFITWAQLKQANPDKKFMVAFRGETYESIWSETTTPEKRERAVLSLASLLREPFPVYKKKSEVTG